jgi:predicted nuclease of predicted toxin-antitoxin system
VHFPCFQSLSFQRKPKTKEDGPSVVQVRAQDIIPNHLGKLVVGVLRAHAEVIERGAPLTIDAAKARVRILPIF